MKKTALIAFAAALAFSANAQQAQKFSATKANEYGLAYSLPNTAIEITIEARMTERQPGEYARYASKYLDIDNPIMQASRSATVVSASMNAIGVPNPDERYLITLKSNQAPYIMIGDNNIPLAINTEEVIVPAEHIRPTEQQAKPTPLQTAAANQVITQEMLQSQSSAKRAQLAAEQIYALRESRKEIITGQAENMPPDGSGMQLALENIDAQEAALLAMFIGTESTYTQVRTFTVSPDDNISNQVIARISPVDGIVDPNDLSGAPVYFSLKITERGKMPVNDKGEELNFPKGGVAYRIPGSAECSLKFDGRTIDSETFSIAQFGIIYGMNPSNFTDRKAPIYIQFDPTTGAIAKTGPKGE